MATEKTPRGQQPKCEGCHHPRSFHGGGKTRCRALGCSCSRFRKPKVVEPVEAKKAAKAVKKAAARAVPAK